MPVEYEWLIHNIVDTCFVGVWFTRRELLGHVGKI